MQTQNFRQLVDALRRRGVPDDAPPRTIAWAAATCGVSVAHLYNLFHGRCVVPEWRIEFMAQRMCVPKKTLRRALSRSRLPLTRAR
jgi:hypothetical protein